MRKLLLLLLLLGSHLMHAADDLQYDRMKVAKIDVNIENLPSSSSFNAASVRTKLQTKVGNLFSQNEFDGDLKKLAEEYDHVEPKVEVINNELYITLRIWIKSKIRSYIFEGNEAITAKKLKGEIDIEEGETFERDAFITGLNKAKLLYVKKGYFEAEMNYELIPVEQTGDVDVKITVVEGRAGRIKSIEFQGLTKKEQDELLDMMVTKKYNLFLSWYTGSGCYHPDMIEHDRGQILNFLQNKGYADAYVDLILDCESCEDKVVLVITVDKGCPYAFGDVCFTGNCLFNNEKICSIFKCYCGAYYSPESIRCTIEAIEDLYGACGYIDAAVDVSLTLREDALVYDVLFTIDEGQQYFVGMVRVFGNRCTQTRVILHENLMCPGDVFDIRKIEGTEARLCNTGYFSTANVYAVRSSDENCNSRDVYIEVEETDTGNLSLFGGFSSLENIFGGIDITERNFNILGITQVFPDGMRRLRGAGEYLHFKFSGGSRETSYLLQWTKPYFMDTQWIVGFDLEKANNRILSRSYEIKTWGGNLHAIYIVNDFLKYDFFYRGLHTHVSASDHVNRQLSEAARISGFISAVGGTLVYDSTDSPRRPTSGFRSRFLCEIAGLGGNFDFMKFGYYNSYYYPLWRRGVIKFRAELQFLHPYGRTSPNGVPLSERLYLGGETTVRGYRNFIIGPKFGNNEPKGGMSAYLLSEEYQHNLLKVPCLDAFVFIDAGYVSFDQFSIGTPAASVGFGLRAEVMRNMPMTVGLGFPIHPGERRNGELLKNTQRFFFSMGGCF